MPSFTLKSNARALAPRRAARAVRPAASFRPVFVNAASTETLDKVRCPPPRAHTVLCPVCV